MWQVLVFLIAFLSPKQSKIKESSLESMAKQMEAHLQEESKLWSFLVLCQKQIMNARRRNKERNLTWRNSRGQQLLDTFQALYGVHFMHAICHFEACEVRSPTLQTVRESELKWRSYSHWKSIAPSCKPISQLRNHNMSCEISLFVRNGDFQLAKFRSPCCMPMKST